MDRIELNDNIFFDFDSDVIQARSFALLDLIAQTMDRSSRVNHDSHRRAHRRDRYTGVQPQSIAPQGPKPWSRRSLPEACPASDWRRRVSETQFPSTTTTRTTGALAIDESSCTSWSEAMTKPSSVRADSWTSESISAPKASETPR